MTGVALRGLLGRKLRATLTAIAIVLGVAMVSGTYILTDTIKAAFSTVFTRAYAHADAVITGKSLRVSASEALSTIAMGVVAGLPAAMSAAAICAAWPAPM